MHHFSQSPCLLEQRELCVASFENVLEILQEMQKHGLIPTKEIVALSIKSALANSRFIDAALLVKMSVDKDVVPIKVVFFFNFLFYNICSCISQTFFFFKSINNLYSRLVVHLFF